MARSRPSQLSRLVSVAIDEGLATRKPLLKPPDGPKKRIPLGQSLPVPAAGGAASLVIDCSAPAWCPNAWTIRPEDQLSGRECDAQFTWDPAKVRLHLDEEQQGNKVIRGELLKGRLADTTVLPANVLDYLQANTELIPESWKKGCVFFWGTVYRCSGGGLYVRFLCWIRGRWRWGYGWFGSDWGFGDPAVVSAG